MKVAGLINGLTLANEYEAKIVARSIQRADAAEPEQTQQHRDLIDALQRFRFVQGGGR